MRSLLSVRMLGCIVSISCCLLAQRSALAVVITSTNSFGSPPAVLAGDLLETSATLTAQSGNFVHEGGLGPSALNDGVFNPAQPGVTTPDNNSFLVYTFDTTAYPLGYEITSIISSGGWADDGRDRQDITVSYTTVDNPLQQLLANINFEPAGIYSSVTLTDSSGSLITGLATLRLDFPNQENAYAGYGEFDVIGAAIVLPAPEPTTATLLGVGMLGLTIVRRRRNQAARNIATTTYDTHVTAK